MSRSVTIFDVAERAHVSPATVTHALNGKRPVGAETKTRIMDAIRDLGYVSSWENSKEKAKSHKVIGCLAADITESFANQIVRGIEEGIPGGEYSLLFASSIEFGNDLARAYDFLKSRSVSGMLFCIHIPFTEVYHLPGTDAGIPLISVNMRMNNPNIVSIVTDNVNAGYRAAEHLYSCGMRHPAILCGPQNRISAADRLAGFSCKLKELDMKLPDTVYYGGYTFEHGYQDVARLMDAYPETDGIFCENDYIAAGCITRLHEKGIEVPGQVRVLGFDDRDFSGFWTPGISTFYQPLREMGFMGIGLLKTMIAAGQSTQKEYVLQPRLIPRGSTVSGWKNN